MLVVFSVLVVVAVLAVAVLFVREGVERRGYLKNARRRPGRIPLN
jgi:heme exporter protein D